MVGTPGCEKNVRREFSVHNPPFPAISQLENFSLYELADADLPYIQQ